MLVSMALIMASAAPLWIKIVVPVLMASVACWLWLRPEV
jgi:hypothetical protein